MALRGKTTRWHRVILSSWPAFVDIIIPDIELRVLSRHNDEINEGRGIAVLTLFLHHLFIAGRSSCRIPWFFIYICSSVGIRLSLCAFLAHAEMIHSERLWRERVSFLSFAGPPGVLVETIGTINLVISD